MSPIDSCSRERLGRAFGSHTTPPRLDHTYDMNHHTYDINLDAAVILARTDALNRTEELLDKTAVVHGNTAVQSLACTPPGRESSVTAYHGTFPLRT